MTEGKKEEKKSISFMEKKNPARRLHITSQRHTSTHSKQLWNICKESSGVISDTTFANFQIWLSASCRRLTHCVTCHLIRCISLLQLLSQFISPHTGRIYGRHITGEPPLIELHLNRLLSTSVFGEQIRISIHSHPLCSGSQACVGESKRKFQKP